jgi:hypothetical protein
MAKNKMSIQFDGLEVYRKQLEQLGGGQAVKRAFDEALEESQKLIAEKVTAAMSPHNNTGKVKRSIITHDPPEWTGDTGAVNVGFDIMGGGLPSIFLMYGTQLYGQPHIQPDRNLYNAVYGATVRKQIREIQEKAFSRVLNEVMNE